MYKADASSTWTQTLSLPSISPLGASLPSCWHLHIEAPEAAAPLWLLVETRPLCTQQHRHRHTQGSPEQLDSDTGASPASCTHTHMHKWSLNQSPDPIASLGAG